LILEEEELIRKCAEGDRHAQTLLFDPYYEEFYIIAMRYLVDHQDAQDVIVKVFTLIFKNLSKFQSQGKGSLGRWMLTILINEAIRILQRRKTIRCEDSADHAEIESPTADAVQQLSANDIMSLIEKLPTGYRTVFNLIVAEGYSHAEIAEMLGISVSTSKTQLKKARHHLMSSITKEEAYGHL
jgi:RNA polymerase sigma factor (sigma-70 family)